MTKGCRKMAKIEGGCLCGQVRYTCSEEPLLTVLCHCKNCQRQSGAAYSTNIAIPKGTVKVKGELTLYADTGDSGQFVNRYFCQECGSPIMSEPEGMDTLSILKVGSLDDTSWVLPTMEIYCDSKQEWTRLQAELMSYSKMMPL
tara:strand:- start:1563 stop:1994 length:432 start_codon:yes stop_codon:yes gene_type:complete